MVTGGRKAMEIQFNWIFILIVGTIILLFFINLSGNIKKNAEKKLASDIISKLSTISSSGKESTNTNQQIEIANLDITTECLFLSCNNISCDTHFDFAGQGGKAPPWMDVEPIFAPKNMVGDSLIMWSLDWSMPYRVGSILYLTTPYYQYILVYNDNNATNTDFAKKLLIELKKNKYINIKMKSISQLDTVEAVGGVFTKYIFLYLPLSESHIAISESIKKSKKYDFMYIVPGVVPLKSGIIYYSKQDGIGKKPDRDNKADYIGVPMLIGAIYSDDYDYYSCNVHKILLKYKDINAVYLARTKAINDYYTSVYDIKCLSYSSPLVIERFNLVNQTISSYLNDLNFDLYIIELVSLASDIESDSESARVKDCAELY
jgi:hypothetical protein